jgi:hypothetical protein
VLGVPFRARPCGAFKSGPRFSTDALEAVGINGGGSLLLEDALDPRPEPDCQPTVAFGRNTATSPRKGDACRTLAAGDGPTRPSRRPSTGVAHEWRGDGVDVAELSGDLLRLSSSAGLTSTRFPGVPVEPDLLESTDRFVEQRFITPGDAKCSQREWFDVGSGTH